MKHKTLGEFQPEFDKLMKKRWFTCHPTNKSKQTKAYAKYVTKIMNTPEFKRKALAYGVHLAIYGSDLGFKWEEE